jgi:hypothetical protein
MRSVFLRRTVAARVVTVVFVVLAAIVVAPRPSYAESTAYCTNTTHLRNETNQEFAATEMNYGGSIYHMLRARTPGSSLGPWENLVLCQLYGWPDGYFAIYSLSAQMWVSAEVGSNYWNTSDYGVLRARATSIGQWETFYTDDWPALWCQCGSVFSFRSNYNGDWVAAELGYSGTNIRYGEMRARTSGAPGIWERWSTG